MNLLITSATTYQTSLTARGRPGSEAETDQSMQLPAASGSAADETSADESASKRPVNETLEANRLSPEEQRQLIELQQRDREVKAHELAHKAVGGTYVTGGSFTYQTGPDGHRYAIGGEVTIDSSPGSTPEESLRKAELIRRAALAPADPSPQDHRVASQASLMAAEARAEISAGQREEIIEARRARNEGDSQEIEENDGVIPRQGQRAIASFEAIGGSSTLHTDADPIDELV